ncbi:MAG: SpoIIE family protein phosphatase [Salinivirgaceae bacterium]|nr:SpoIIE family protein phosphatase [Salinivirgaceae bacterium]
MKKLLFIGLLLGLAFISQGEIVITDANADKPIDLSENIFYYEDPTGGLTFETATSEKFFRNYTQLQNNIVRIGGNKNDIWVLIPVKNSTKRRQSFFLSLRNPHIDELVFHSVIDSTFFNTGMRYPFSQRPSDSKNYNFVVTIPPAVTATYCIKFTAQHNVMYVPIEMKPGKQFFDEGTFNQTMNGLVYALALLTILAMLLLYISEKDKLYISSMLLMICITILLLVYDLTFFKYLFPNSPTANANFSKIMKPLTLTAFIYYQKYCLSPQPFKKLKSDPSNLTIILGLLTTFLSFLSFEHVFRILALNIFIFLTFAYFFYCVISNRNKLKDDKGFVIHVIVSGTILVSLVYKNVIDTEIGMLVYTSEHCVKIALLTLSALSMVQFGRKFVKSRTEYYEMSRNMEKSINKRTELINLQKEVLNAQREELIQQKNTLQDQREELRAQKELLQLKNNELGKFLQVTNRSNNRIVIFRPNGEINWYNAAFANRIHTDYEEYKSGPTMNLLDLSSDPEALKKALSLCLENKMPTSYEVEEPDNSWRQVTLTPILDAQEDVTLIIAVGTNISQLKQYEQKIEQQKAEAEAQRNIALLQRDEIEAKQNEIFGSIRYAKRIQTAMMPKVKQIQRDFNDSFVLFMPKDIVSGDFYWYHRIDNKYFIAAVDCTGHGVPGAFLSIIGSYLLNSIVIHNAVHRPADILKHLNRKIKISLKSEGMLDQNNDGMDIAIAVIDKENHLIEYAGALRPMYLYCDNKFVELKGDKIPITSNISGTSVNSNYTNHEHSFKPGDQFYIFSDGIIDQFGGDDGKKYLTKRFKDLLDEIKDLPMKEQKNLIVKAHDEWRGRYDQVDDILVIGIRYNSQDL